MGTASGVITIGIGGMHYAYRGEMACLAVGSCVALALVNAETGHAAMAHIFLPRAPAAPSCEGCAGKYADLALPEMAERLRAGVPDAPIEAFVAGGARMFPNGFQQNWLDVGAMNGGAVLALLDELRITVRFSDLGGVAARNVLFNVATRTMTIRTR